MTKLTKAGIAILATMSTVALASASWSEAQRDAERFKSKADDLSRELPDQAKKVVTAACNASDDDRGNAASNAASDVRSRVNDKFNEVERMERDAVDKLEHLDDKDQKDYKDEARRLADEVRRRFDKLKDQTSDLRNGARDIVDYMKQGERAIRDHSPHCDARDVSMDAGRAACIVQSGDTCKIIEFSSASSRAVDKARDRANRFKSQLEREIERKDKGEGSDLMKRLISNHSDFARCKRAEVRVDCYTQCPDIDSEGRLRDRSPSWREDC